MDIDAVKQKIINGEMTDEELAKLLTHKPSSSHPRKENSGFMSTILKGFIDGYAQPHLWRLILETVLILSIVVGVVILSYAGKIDATITVVILAFIIGFIFGKMK